MKITGRVDLGHGVGVVYFIIGRNARDWTLHMNRNHIITVYHGNRSQVMNQLRLACGR